MKKSKNLELELGTEIVEKQEAKELKMKKAKENLNMTFDNNMTVDVADAKPALDVDFDASKMPVDICKAQPALDVDFDAKDEDIDKFDKEIEEAIEETTDATREEWEKISDDLINATRDNYVEIGQMLVEIRDRKMYLADIYTSFEQAVSDKCDMSVGRAYQYIQAYNMYNVLKDGGIDDKLLPINEAQCRAIMAAANRNVDPDDKGKLHDTAVTIWRELTKGGKVPNSGEIAAYGSTDTDKSTSGKVDADTKSQTKVKPISTAVRGFARSLLDIDDVNEADRDKYARALTALQKRIAKILKQIQG